MADHGVHLSDQVGNRFSNLGYLAHLELKQKIEPGVAWLILLANLLTWLISPSCSLLYAEIKEWKESYTPGVCDIFWLYFITFRNTFCRAAYPCKKNS